jgi:hypothetical protein
VLESRTEQHTFIVTEDILRPIAVMDVEIDDRNPFEIVLSEGMGRADGNVVEQAKAHCPISLRVVSGRTDTTECGVVLSLRYKFDSGDCRACGTPGSLSRGRSDDRVGIETRIFPCAGCGVDSVDVRRRMHAKQLLATCYRRIDVGEQVPEPRFHQPIFDSRQPSTAFRVVFASVMIEASPMTYVGSLQGGIPVLSE